MLVLVLVLVFVWVFVLVAVANIFNRPNVARAVLQTPQALTD